MSELDGSVTKALLGIPRDGGAASETLWASDATAKLLKDLHFALGEGTCIEAATSGRPVSGPYLHDAAEVARWPAFVAAVRDQSAVRVIAALPLRWGAIHLGVLTLYSRTQGSLSPNQRSDAMSAADIATSMTLGVRTDPGDGHRPHLSLRNHPEIHQATEQLTLNGVAKDVVARLLSFTPDSTRGSSQ